MCAGTVVPLSEYLSTSYDPDVEYVDGALVERNVGDVLHSLVESNIIVSLAGKCPHFYTLPGLRCRTTETRYRLPDVCVVQQFPGTDYLIEPAWIAIEVLSDDRMSGFMEKLAEYENAGVTHIWVVDPRLKLMLVYSRGNLTFVEGFATPDGITLTREEVFAR